MTGRLAGACPLLALLAIGATPLDSPAQRPVHSPTPVRDDSVSIRIVNTDLRAAVQLLSQYLDRPVLFTGPAGLAVTLETPQRVPRGDVIRLLRGLLESQNYELVADTAARLYRARQKEPARASPVGAPNESQRPAMVSGPQSAPPAGPTELFAIPLRHARAADVAATVNALYGRASAAGDVGTRRATLGDELRGNQVPPVGTAPAQTAVGVPARPAVFSGDVNIVPDARLNTLLVRANRTDFALIQAVVQQVDVRPLQVLIEVLIVEAQRDRSLSFGVDAALGDSRVGRGSPATINAHQTGGATGLGDFALNVMHLGAVDLDVTLRAAAGRGDLRILSRPVVIAANNEEAQIVVGSQRPFVQVSRALPTDNAARDQVVQYKDVGTKLSVKPTISGDGLVQLDVTQEISNATGETAFNAPVISNRSISTQLLIRDGQTVALGGLTDREREVGGRGIPVLSSIPGLGGLFGSYSRATTETELFIFLTPRVIRSDEDAERLSQPMRSRASEARP